MWFGYSDNLHHNWPVIYRSNYVTTSLAGESSERDLPATHGFGGFASWFMGAEEVVHVWCSQVRSGQPGLQITEPPWILSLTSLGFAQGIHVSKLWQTGVNDIALCTILQWLIYIYIISIYIIIHDIYIINDIYINTMTCSFQSETPSIQT